MSDEPKEPSAGIARVEQPRVPGSDDNWFLMIGDVILDNSPGSEVPDYLDYQRVRINAEHERICPYKTEKAELRANLEALCERVIAWPDALHKDDCGFWATENYQSPCTCGLTALLEGK